MQKKSSQWHSGPLFVAIFALLQPGVAESAQGVPQQLPFALPTDLVAAAGPHSKPELKVFIPDDNPLTASRIALGELLFSDKRLSRHNTLACISCHQPENSFASSLVTGRKKNPPVIFNRLFSRKQFWDARAEGLEEQVRQTMTEPTEMNLSGKEAVTRLRKDPNLVGQFHKIFGKTQIVEEDLYRVLASFVRSIVTYDSKFDRANRKMPSAELTYLEEHGRELFFEKYKCSTCHSGPNFTNEILSPPCYPQFGQAVKPASTVRQPFNQQFKTPSLRGLAKSAPYFHNGSLAEIGETILFYDRSGSPPMNFSNAELFQVPINKIAGAEVEQLKAFLGTLNGRIEYGYPRKSIGN